MELKDIVAQSAANVPGKIWIVGKARAAVAASLAPATEAEPATSEAKFVTPITLALFQGYESVGGNGRNTAVSGTKQNTGAGSSVNYTICRDEESLRRALNVNQSFSADFAGIGSLSEKMSMIQDISTSSTSISIVVGAQHGQGTDFTTDVHFKDGMGAPFTTRDALKTFFQAYGDSYVSSLTTGGEYYAVYTFYADTMSEFNEVQASISASGMADGGTVDASLQVKLSTLVKSSKTRLAFNQLISGIANPSMPAPSGLVDFALGFPHTPLDSPTIIDFGVTGYESVPNVGDFSSVTTARRHFVGDNFGGGLLTSYSKLMGLQSAVAKIKSAYATYGGYTDSTLTTRGSQVDADLNTLLAQMRGYQQDPTQTFADPNLPSLGYGTPSLSFTARTSTPQGQGGGDSFSDTDVNTAIAQRLRPVKLMLRGGGYVDRLEVTYQTPSGTPVTDGHGGSGGGASQTLSLGPNDVVTSISGRSGEYVDHLKITGTGGSIEVGGAGGAPFTLSVPSSGVFLIGFLGRAGEYLDQVETVGASFNPASWS